MSEEITLTKEGLDKLNVELDQLKNVKRRQIAERIRLAKEFGDLSENAEYHEAKEEQSFAEGRIQELEHLIRYSRIAESAKGDTVSVGSTVDLKGSSTHMTIRVVGSTEADPSMGKISLDSPLGQAIIGRKSGEIVSISTPNGVIHYTIATIR